jgi:hypothetical protein
MHRQTHVKTSGENLRREAAEGAIQRPRGRVSGMSPGGLESTIIPTAWNTHGRAFDVSGTFPVDG